MKKLFFMLGIMLAAGAVKAQTCELRNNSTQTVRVRLVALRGSTEYFSDVIPLAPSTTTGPYTVASASWPWTGPTPPAGAYVHVIQVEVSSCGDFYAVDYFNPDHTNCLGTPDQFDTHLADIGGLSVVLHNN